jgi:23S rRNA (guanosine2251-2'-O)-methyltransferase
MIIVGKNAVAEAIKAGRKIEEVYIQENTNKELLVEVQKRQLKTRLMAKQELQQLLPRHHQGIGAKVEDYVYMDLEDAIKKDKSNKVFVMLDGLEDPHNLGAILRSADAFGVDGIIVPKNRSVGITDTVVKVSTGAIEYVDIIQVTNLHQTLRTLKERGFWVVGTDMDTQDTIHDFHVDTDLCIVIGSEGKGMSRLIRDNCDYIVKIPMEGHVNSLNASVSCALVLYEVMRRRGK